MNPFSYASLGVVPLFTYNANHCHSIDQLKGTKQLNRASGCLSLILRSIIRLSYILPHIKALYEFPIALQDIGTRLLVR